ncbi:MAG: tRNA 2-thiouridine(34) synthase MnmA [Candidatus Moraniibacteriota bacterium]|nr:MAG: tRNA 2-thiouridine(34) synthase MnmA [Candidatus Moranbacteria bacterium]
MSTIERGGKVAALVSGGVDSSVSLALLKNAGYDVRAFYLKIWLQNDLSFLGECPWEDDLRDVRAVCELLAVPLQVVSFQKEYWSSVVSYVLEETRAGRTPNPDMLCNARVKFGAFWNFIESKQFQWIGTGHYAQTKLVRGKTKLLVSPDLVKDQTYFLSQLSPTQISRALFPIGKYEKSEVRKLAREFSLPNAERKDSQGICFLGKIRFDEFLKHSLGVKRGDLIEYETGKKVGEHEGFWYFTVGQRKGIKLSGGPWFVVSKDIKKNIVFISNAWRGAQGSRDSFVARAVKWVSGSPPRKRRMEVKIRHGALRIPCRIRAEGASVWTVTLPHKEAGVAPGQFAVFYDGNECLGGGRIETEELSSE